MFVLDLYREPEPSWILDTMRRNPLALLTSNGDADSAPYATHVPVIIDPTLSEDPADLVGTTLWGHLNRANPHWAALGRTGVAGLVFRGPGGYVSPTVYQTCPAAPTWDFVAVHVRGSVQRLLSEEAGMDTVTQTVRAFEGRFGDGWDPADSQSYFRSIVPGVGAFRMVVTHVDAMFKLSQEQPSEVRDRVHSDFASRESSEYREIAALMGRLG